MPIPRGLIELSGAVGDRDGEDVAPASTRFSATTAHTLGRAGGW